MKRELTELEKQFVAEAEAGCFLVGYDDDGSPYALGAKATDNLFSVDVIETPDRDGAIYTLRATPSERTGGIGDES